MNQHGFTLIEVLLSVAILTLLAGLSLPVYESFLRRNDLDITTQSIAMAIRRAQVHSRGADGNDTWGIEFLSSGVTLFKGSSYASRTAAYDETVPLPASVSLAGFSEVVFSKLSGAPNTTGSITLSSTVNDSRTITINAKGLVSY